MLVCLSACVCVCVCVLFVCLPWLDVRNLITLSEAFMLYTIKPADLKFCFAFLDVPFAVTAVICFRDVSSGRGRR